MEVFDIDNLSRVRRKKLDYINIKFPVIQKKNTYILKNSY